MAVIPNYFLEDLLNIYLTGFWFGCMFLSLLNTECITSQFLRHFAHIGPLSRKWSLSACV